MLHWMFWEGLVSPWILTRFRKNLGWFVDSKQQTFGCRMETSALCEDVCWQPHLQIPPQIHQSPALSVLLCQTQLFTLKWDLPAENKQAARRECHKNAAAGGHLLHSKPLKGQQRPAVTPLDREMDSLVSAAWHLHHVLSKWPWRQGWGT